jgi:hypothetical protein
MRAGGGRGYGFTHPAVITSRRCVSLIDAEAAELVRYWQRLLDTRKEYTRLIFHEVRRLTHPLRLRPLTRGLTRCQGE